MQPRALPLRLNFSASCPHCLVRALLLQCHAFEIELRCGLYIGSNPSPADLTCKPRAAAFVHSAQPLGPLISHAGFPILLPGFRWPTTPALLGRKAPAQPQPPRHRRVAKQTRHRQWQRRPLVGRRPPHHPRHPRARNVEITLASAWRLVESGPEHALRHRRAHQPVRERLLFTQRNVGIGAGAECGGEGAQWLQSQGPGLLQQALSADIHEPALELWRQREAGPRTVPEQQGRAIAPTHWMALVAPAEISGCGALYCFHHHHFLRDT